jgi:hypothetical protein
MVLRIIFRFSCCKTKGRRERPALVYFDVLFCSMHPHGTMEFFIIIPLQLNIWLAQHI